MTTAAFSVDRGVICGFVITGHSGYGETGQDIVCAAISSAAFLTANLLTDYLGADAEASAEDDILSLHINARDNVSDRVLQGFFDQIRELHVQYPCNLRIIKVKTGGKQ